MSRQDQPVVAASFGYRLDVIGCPRQRMGPYQFRVDGQMTLPSGNCLSRHPENVLTKWCYRTVRFNERRGGHDHHPNPDELDGWAAR